MKRIIRLNVQNLRNLIRKVLWKINSKKTSPDERYKRILKSCRTSHFKEVKYFHPSGKSMPNSICYHRGRFVKECIDNENRFVISEHIHPEQYGLSKYKGGLIVFSSDVNAIKLDTNKLKDVIKQTLATFRNRFFKDKMLKNIMNKFNDDNPTNENIGAYSIGNFFKGKYVGDNGESFSEKSTSVEINGLSTTALLHLAEFLCKVFKQETVLVKDLNNGKIYLADPLKVKDATPIDDENNTPIRITKGLYERILAYRKENSPKIAWSMDFRRRRY